MWSKAEPLDRLVENIEGDDEQDGGIEGGGENLEAGVAEGALAVGGPLPYPNG